MNPDKIKEILDKIDIDDRIKLIIVSYFKGKIEKEGLDEQTLKTQLRALCNRIRNIEFVDYPDVGVAYERSASILTINKRYFEEGRLEDIIALIFAKFEEALDIRDYNDMNENWTSYCGDKGASRHIYYFLNGAELAQNVGLPVSEEQISVAELLKEGYIQNEEAFFEHERNDGSKLLYLEERINLDKRVNDMLVSGKVDISSVLPLRRIIWSGLIDKKYAHENIKSPEYQGYIAKLIALAGKINGYQRK